MSSQLVHLIFVVIWQCSYSGAVICTTIQLIKTTVKLQELHFFTESNQSKRMGVMIPALIIVLALAIASAPWCYKFARHFFPMFEPLIINSEPEEQFMLHLCTETNATYEYQIIFRVGCPTHHFDMKHSYIDFEIKVDPPTGDNEQNGDITFGKAARFNCAKLTNIVCGEMHLLIGSQVPIGQIVGIQAHHNDKHGAIFLYEYVLIDLPTDKVLEVGRIEQYLTNKPTTYRTKLLCKTDNEMGLFTRLPITWNYTELGFIAGMIIVLNAFLIILAEYFTICPLRCKHQDGSLYCSLFIIVCVMPISVFVLTVVTLCYKYYIKR